MFTTNYTNKQTNEARTAFNTFTPDDTTHTHTHTPVAVVVVASHSSGQCLPWHFDQVATISATAVLDLALVGIGGLCCHWADVVQAAAVVVSAHRRPRPGLGRWCGWVRSFPEVFQNCEELSDVVGVSGHEGGEVVRVELQAML